MSTQDDYWKETVAIAVEECGAVLTPEQIDSIAGAVQSSHENYGMAFYSPPAGEHYRSEIDKMKRQMKEDGRAHEEERWLLEESIIRAKGLNPAFYYIRREGKQVFIEGRR